MKKTVIYIPFLTIISSFLVGGANPPVERTYVTNEAQIVMVGDVLLHDRIEEGAKKNDSYDFSSLFKNVRNEISSADLAIVNEEVIIGGKQLGVSGYPAFNSPTEVADALVDTGFDVICHGTNHALDKGKKGIINCLNYWDNTYPETEVIGIHDTAEDQAKISYITVNNIKIAIFNYTYGTNGISLPSDMPYAVDYLNETRVKNELAIAREHSDFIIVCPHWGTEYRLSPDSSQEKWTKIFLDAGADLVLGTHPHVIEPIEMIDNRMLVYYSLGNFVNWTSGTGNGTSNRMLGGMANITIKKEKGITSIKNYNVEALVAHVQSGPGNVTTYFLRDYNENLASQNEIKKQDSSFSYDYLINLANEVWGDKWK